MLVHDILTSMNIVHVFIIGIAILVGALLLNALASWLNLSTWYDFIKSRENTTTLSYIWLFVIYPFLLGLIAYLTIKGLV